MRGGLRGRPIRDRPVSAGNGTGLPRRRDTRLLSHIIMNGHWAAASMSARPNNSDHRARRRRRAAAPGSDPRPAADIASWHSIIDGWVKDQKIRRDALTCVGMLLTTVVVVVWIIFHAGDSALAPVLSTSIGKIISSIAVTIAGGRALLWRRRHRHPTRQLRTGPRNTIGPSGTPPRTAQTNRPSRGGVS